MYVCMRFLGEDGVVSVRLFRPDMAFTLFAGITPRDIVGSPILSLSLSLSLVLGLESPAK